MLRTIGLMSGTSLDGVDAAAIETDGVGIGRIGRAVTVPYSAGLRADLRRLLDLAPRLALDDPFVADVTARLTCVHVDAVLALGEPAELIGFHGQTILHQPQCRRTWQIGDAAALAKATGRQVAHDFRSADVAAGGQGAPLVPLFHAALAAGLRRPLAVLNLGGVANVTYLTDAGITAADVGPGNGPLDDWVARHGLGSHDQDGRTSAAGAVDASVLAELLADPFFARPWPKSLDRLDFSARLSASGLDGLSAVDGAATLVAFIAEAVRAAALAPLRWLVCGGGRHNPSIMQALRQVLGAPVDPVEVVGWDGDALEAQCFGYLAARTLAGLPLTLPGTTGVLQPTLGGRLT
jgi:anhydro-N-acetylmuramic acid kinase